MCAVSPVELTGPVSRGAVTVTRAGEDLSVTSSSATLGVRNTASVSTGPASVSRDGTDATAHWRAAARDVEVMVTVGSREDSGPAGVRMAGEERPVRGDRRQSARTR